MKFRLIDLFFVLACTCFMMTTETSFGAMAQDSVPPSSHEVHRLRGSLTIDGNWDKKQWKKQKSIFIGQYMGKAPHFKPQTEAKMMYDDENLYVIFRVQDKHVLSRVQDINGNVSGDACVEFFFSPDSDIPERYFNLEVNAGGTPLLFYVTTPWTGFQKLDREDIKQVEIAHSLPSRIDPEISDPVTWTIEYRVPLSILKKFSNVTPPKPGTVWRANFYKTASNSTNPHWITWSFVNHPTPNFHLPQYFGKIIFK